MIAGSVELGEEHHDVCAPFVALGRRQRRALSGTLSFDELARAFSRVHVEEDLQIRDELTSPQQMRSGERRSKDVEQALDGGFAIELAKLALGEAPVVAMHTSTEGFPRDDAELFEQW